MILICFLGILFNKHLNGDLAPKGLYMCIHIYTHEERK